MTKNLTDNKDTSSYLHEQKWGDEKNSSTLILAVHGYNDHSKSFEIPANFFKNLIFSQSHLTFEVLEKIQMLGVGIH